MAGTSTDTGWLVAEGKTKKIWGTEKPNIVVIESKDDLTAGDGAKHDVVEGKAALATQTTCNVFRLLQACGLPVAFVQQVEATRFLAPQCRMIPYEVVVRREAHGSYLKRHPELSKRHYFPQLVCELFLKTSGRQWDGHELPKDDPLIEIRGEKAQLYLPDQLIRGQKPFLTLEDYPLKDDPNMLERVEKYAYETFLILEKAWQLLDLWLVDFKLEFGIDAHGDLLVADVIDNDSWRIRDAHGNYLDKQLYRDGAGLEKVEDSYRLVADLTSRFNLTRQQIILWRGSPSDDLKPYEEALRAYGLPPRSLLVQPVVCSLHKDPVRGYDILQRLVQEVPDSVIIAHVGMSNGAGPTLAANTHVPVITVSPSWKEVHEDVWSSLRAPSAVPVMTVLEPKNAVLAALQILAMRNPALYASLRLVQEERLVNFVTL